MLCMWNRYYFLLLHPLGFMLLTAKAFIVISFLLEQLLKVGLAIDDAFQGGICSNTEKEKESSKCLI